MDIREDILKRIREIIGLDKCDIEEIDLSVGGHGLKPGGGRRFPEQNQPGGDSLNLSVSDGPHKFPNEKNF